MRWSIAVALGLFATNIVVLELREKPRRLAAPQAELMGTVEMGVVDVGIPRLRTPDGFHVSETQRLAWLHTAWRAGFHPQGCAHYDPLAILDADVDPEPGREHVIGNREYGVAMYAESGELLAYMHPIGCGHENDGDQSLSLSYKSRLILTVQDVSEGVRTYTAHVVDREADQLVERIDLQVGHLSSTRETETKLAFSGFTVEAITHGREYKNGAWQPVDTHCNHHLLTRSFSCRTRVAEQTSEPE